MPDVNGRRRPSKLSAETKWEMFLTGHCRGDHPGRGRPPRTKSWPSRASTTRSQPGLPAPGRVHCGRSPTRGCTVGVPAVATPAPWLRRCLAGIRYTRSCPRRSLYAGHRGPQPSQARPTMKPRGIHGGVSAGQELEQDIRELKGQRDSEAGGQFRRRWLVETPSLGPPWSNATSPRPPEPAVGHRLDVLIDLVRGGPRSASSPMPAPE